MRFITASFLIVIFSCAKYQVNANGDWCYEGNDCGPSHWAGDCKTGKSQSPIDLNSTLARNRADRKTLRLDDEYFKFYDNFFILNNGHSIQIQLKDTARSDCLMDGAGLKGSYIFAQMHFHWGSNSNVGSEHTVDGKHYPMELHLVHYSDKYDTLVSALQDSNRRAVAVLGIFFEITERDNPAIQSIVNEIPKVREPEHTLVAKPAQGRLNLTALLPRNLELWRYEGSLTTPSCAEKVVWSVFRHPIGISEKQLNEFRSAKDSHGKPLVNNFRPTLALARRVVKYINVDQLLRKTDDPSNEIEDDPDASESTTIDQHDTDSHGHGIDHENDETHTHSGEDNSIDSNKDSGAQRISTPLLSILLCIFLCCSASQISKILQH
ncbi:unnamed protein product [Allacma fusca]|uniref:Carbonic anhydrase n=1 Tax=Allacma fusca TaxID=39272 RepID=A0A8J2KYD6_9HEXA|nr:unnamed protein product [Allacma fusca]